MPQRGTSCSNYNHRRDDASVRCCPSCGEVVNEDIPAKMCSEAEHDLERKDLNKFCAYCGEQLK